MQFDHFDAYNNNFIVITLSYSYLTISFSYFLFLFPLVAVTDTGSLKRGLLKVLKNIQFGAGKKSKVVAKKD